MLSSQTKINEGLWRQRKPLPDPLPVGEGVQTMKKLKFSNASANRHYTRRACSSAEEAFQVVEAIKAGGFRSLRHDDGARAVQLIANCKPL